jgi:hypothetical protein
MSLARKRKERKPVTEWMRPMNTVLAEIRSKRDTPGRRLVEGAPVGGVLGESMV